MPFDDPSEITGLGLAKDEAASARVTAQHQPNLAHGCDEFLTLRLVQRRQQGVDCPRLQPVELVECPAAFVGQPNDLAAARTGCG
jgi:hypothetical protein